MTAWNIRYGEEYQRIRNALASVLRSDIFLLQEVDRMTRRTRDRRTGAFRDLPPLLAQDLRMHFAYGIVFQELKQDAPGRPAFTGQQTLSTFPLSRAEPVRFRNQLADWSKGWLGFWEKRNGGRIVLYCQASIGDVAVHLYNAHLESRASDRRKLSQLEEILEHVEANVAPEEPTIVGGDLNTRKSERSPVVKRLFRAGFVDALQERSPGKNPTNFDGDERLDWIFSRNLAPIEARLSPGLLGSDHRAVSVTYRAPRATPAHLRESGRA